MATNENTNTIPVKESQSVTPNPKECLDENTRKVFFSKFSYGGIGSYDPSVFVEALRDKKGDLCLYVPARKRMAWFKTDYPDGMVIPDPPQYNMHRVMVVARVYKTAEDFKNNQPAAVNMATRLLDDKDPYVVDVCITRAQSRALRDMGYDIPRDAHIIEGWTPIKDSDKDIPEENADALEASVVIKNYVSDLEPKVTPDSAENVVEQPVQAEPVAAPAEPSAASTDSADKKPKPGAKKVGRPRKKGGEDAAEKDSAPETASDADPAEVTKSEAEANAAGESAATEAPEQKTSSSADEVLERAQNAFPSIEDAEAYTSRLLGGKSVGEQNDLRIKYFAEKALKADCRDEKLGLATYLVANHRGIAL